MNTYIIVNLQVEGVHRWDSCDIEEVSYLKNEHRHIFHIKAVKKVNHQDRDVEIIKFKRLITAFLLESFYRNGSSCDFKDMSCEMIAEKLLKRYDLFSCEVLEDGENGAIVTSL